MCSPHANDDLGYSDSWLNTDFHPSSTDLCLCLYNRRMRHARSSRAPTASQRFRTSYTRGLDRRDAEGNAEELEPRRWLDRRKGETGAQALEPDPGLEQG
jgi:hypothetical protein